ncbi:hypothetical protein D3W54_15960 (plasmid) [Komagataeibacter medellinensis]|uniref:Bacteriophage Mu Gp45 N-terminal domain-containing protein n=1 Tax=Komagataeibacter medellinensis TaxID=1177712 RepID=A0ABQ6VVV8_9PROT|nr:phage baseplate assembly protein [Komagataeibacter medellinensis]KAB8122203.1 hypothetical protein D3W54_15960 [Komagataeibacter medellinensis]
MERRIKECENRIIHLVKSGTVSNNINTKDTIHTCQVTQMAGYEVHNNVPVYGTWGIASTAPVGSQAITLSGYGAANNKIVIATHDVKTHPKNMGEGETQLYDANGQSLYLSIDGVVVSSKDVFEIKQGNNTIFTIDKNGVSINANVKVTGAITATGDIKAGNISLDSHTHSGVEAGSANTGAPQ